MTRVLRGVVHGRTIEVSEDLGLSDGEAVDLLVAPSGSLEPSSERRHARGSARKLPGPPPGWKPGVPSRSAGILADEWTEEDDRILEQIQADRQAATWRELPE